MPKSYRYRSNREVQALFPLQRLNASILREQFQNVHECLLKKGAANTQLELSGIIKIEQGNMFISSIKALDDDPRAKSNADCIAIPLSLPRRNVANGLKYHTALHGKNFTFSFKGLALPEVSGSVRIEGYPEIEEKDNIEKF